MISLTAFFIFLFAASLPVTYICLLRHWLEPESVQSNKEGVVESAEVHWFHHHHPVTA